jgi:hypothetical protein
VESARVDPKPQTLAKPTAGETFQQLLERVSTDELFMAAFRDGTLERFAVFEALSNTMQEARHAPQTAGAILQAFAALRSAIAPTLMQIKAEIAATNAAKQKAAQHESWRLHSKKEWEERRRKYPDTMFFYPFERSKIEMEKRIKARAAARDGVS